jgi:hypothetical protein
MLASIVRGWPIKAPVLKFKFDGAGPLPTGPHGAAVDIGCSRKKRSISRAASGPRGSV